MRIQIPRNVYTTPLRPLHVLAARPSLKPVRNRLYNSTLTSTKPSSQIDTDLFVQPAQQGGPLHPFFSSRQTHATVNQLVVLGSQSTPMQEYRKLVEGGGLRLDDHQTRIIQKLQTLHDALAVYAPPPPVETLSLVSMCPPFFPFLFH
jgi:hypothetical protein